MNTENKLDHAQVKMLPPVYYLMGLALGWLLNSFLPTFSLSYPVVTMLGKLLIAIAFLIAGWGVWHLYRAKTAIDVRKPTTQIVSTGPYRFTRNPLYLSLLILVTGIALARDVFWVLLMLPLIIMVVNRAVISHEEKYLEGKFGEEYLNFKASVRRWI